MLLAPLTELKAFG